MMGARANELADHPVMGRWGLQAGAACPFPGPFQEASVCTYFSSLQSRSYKGQASRIYAYASPAGRG